MAGLSIYGRAQMLNAVFRRDVFDDAADWWLALTTIVPMAGDTGAHLAEPTDVAYARQPYGNTAAYWDASGLGTIGNSQALTYPVPTVDWGVVNGWALVDSADGDGNLWLIGELVTPARVIAGPDAAVVVEAYALQLTEI
jgi:hypothetical protein